MDSQAYADGSMYEIFVCRAHRKYRHEVSGADSSCMKNLINTENGADLRRLAGSYEKQLENIKKHMGKALDKYLKFKLTPDERVTVERLKTKLAHAQDSADLMAIVNDGITATQRFIEH